MCQVHAGAYVSLLTPGETNYSDCHPRKTTTYILHVVSITTHTHDMRKSIGENKQRKEKKRKEKKKRQRKGKKKEQTKQKEKGKKREGKDNESKKRQDEKRKQGKEKRREKRKKKKKRKKNVILADARNCVRMALLLLLLLLLFSHINSRQKSRVRGHTKVLEP